METITSWIIVFLVSLTPSQIYLKLVKSEVKNFNRKIQIIYHFIIYSLFSSENNKNAINWIIDLWYILIIIRYRTNIHAKTIGLICKPISLKQSQRGKKQWRTYTLFKITSGFQMYKHWFWVSQKQKLKCQHIQQ